MAKNSKDIVEPSMALASAPVEQPQAAPAAVVVPPAECHFRKWFNPFEEIVFKDGSTFRFPGKSFSTTDKELIRKIKEVAAVHGIES